MLLSPESLIKEISGDAPLPFDFPPLIRRIIKDIFKDRPGLPIKIALLDAETNFYSPLHPPRLAMEYLDRCGLLFAECMKLRDRIEALQLDIFNFHQSVQTHNADIKQHRPSMRLLWDSDAKHLQAQYFAHLRTKALIQENVTTVDNATKIYPPHVTGTADDAWMNVYRITDRNRLNIELANENAVIADLQSQISQQASSRERTETQWKTDDDLYTQKIEMLGVGGRLALDTRLGGSLHRYSSLMRDLKEYMFSAEWGLEHVFGVWNETPWEDLDVDTYADEKFDAPLDELGERLIRMSNAAYGFQLMETAIAVSARVELSQIPTGELIGTVRLPFPADTGLALVRRIRARGPLVKSASVKITRTTPFVTRGSRDLPDWLTHGNGVTAEDLAKWRPAYAAAVETASSSALADMSSVIAFGRLCTNEADQESYIADRTLSYSSALGDWNVTVSSPDSEMILAHGLWIDVIASRALAR